MSNTTPKPCNAELQNKRRSGAEPDFVSKAGGSSGARTHSKNRDRRSGHPQRGKCATRASAWGLHRLFINFLHAGRSSKTPGNEIGRGLKQICNEMDQFQKLKPKQGFKDLSTTFPSACPRLMGKTDWIDARPWCFPASGSHSPGPWDAGSTSNTSRTGNLDIQVYDRG